MDRMVDIRRVWQESESPGQVGQSGAGGDAGNDAIGSYDDGQRRVVTDSPQREPSSAVDGLSLDPSSVRLWICGPLAVARVPLVQAT